MKAGIVSLYGMINYGNRLQNIALAKVIERLKVSAENYIDVPVYDDLKNIARILIKESGKNKMAVKEVMRYLKFKKFSSLVKNTYVGMDPKKKQNKFDYFICGSDQIWNYQFTKGDFYFASFAPEGKRIAYAASFGVSDIPESEKERYANNLNGMKMISVREQAGAKIVKELTGRDADVLIDPTMMLTKEEWCEFSKKPKFNIPQKYILTYFLGDLTEKTKIYINKICRDYGISLIDLSHTNKNKYWYSTGPSEFLWLIEHCSLMITDSFHGSVFSVIMDVPFIVVDRVDKRQSMNSRIDTLLEKLNLQDRRFDDQTDEETIFKHDYNHVDKIFKHERDKSITFLKNAMGLE